jgi:hypothetical protein
MKIEHYLLLASIQTGLSAVVAFLSFFKFRSRDVIVRLMGFVFLTGALANTAAYLLVKSGTFRGYSNLAPSVYLMISLCLFSRIYFILLGKKNAPVFQAVSIAFVCFSSFNIFFLQGTQINSYSRIFYAAIVIVYCLLYFYVLMKDLPSLYLHTLPMFWFNSALLIFHAGAFFLFSFQDYLVNVLKNDMVTYGSFQTMLSIVEHIIFIVGLGYDFRLLKSGGAEGLVQTRR